MKDKEQNSAVTYILVALVIIGAYLLGVIKLDMSYQIISRLLLINRKYRIRLKNLKRRLN